MPDPIANVRRKASARKRADAALRQAITEARAAGHTLQAIADALGVSRQAVHKLTKR